MSVETEAAVGLELGTLSVLVSDMWIFSIGRFRQWEQTYITCKHTPQNHGDKHLQVWLPTKTANSNQNSNHLTLVRARQLIERDRKRKVS